LYVVDQLSRRRGHALFRQMAIIQIPFFGMFHGIVYNCRKPGFWTPLEPSSGPVPES